MANIVVIENQYTQFDTICDRLVKAKHNVIPSLEEYPKVIDWVRVYLDDRSSRRKQFVTEKLKNYFEEKRGIVDSKKIDLLILDFKLSGNENSGNGANLATELRKGMGFTDVHIIFFSQSAHNDEIVQKALETVPNYTWVEKGYVGAGIEDENYFKKKILLQIPLLIAKTANRNYEEMLKKLRWGTDQIFQEYYGQLDNLIEEVCSLQGLTKKAKELVVFFYENYGTLSRFEISECFKQYK